MNEALLGALVWAFKGLLGMLAAWGLYTVKKTQADVASNAANITANEKAVAACRADSEKALAAYKLEAFQTFVNNATYLRLEQKIDERFDRVIEEIRAAPRCPYEGVKPCKP